MSMTEIDAVTWRIVYTDVVAQLINTGLDLKAARQLAIEQMDRAFICSDFAVAREQDADLIEHNREMWHTDMGVP